MRLPSYRLTRLLSRAHVLGLSLSLSLFASASAEDCVTYGDYIHNLGVGKAAGGIEDFSAAHYRDGIVYGFGYEFEQGQRFVVQKFDNPQTTLSMIDASWVEDFALVGDYVFAAADETLDVIDVSDPSNATAVASLPLPGSSRIIDVVGELAYIPAWHGGLHIVDISNPVSPTLLGTADVHCSEVVVVGDYAYTSSFTLDRLEVIDVSDPLAPFAVNHTMAIEPAWLETDGELLFASVAGTNRIRAFTLENPTTPLPAGEVEIAESGFIRALEAHGSHLYASTSAGGWALIQVIGPQDLVSLGRAGVRDVFGFSFDDHTAFTHSKHYHGTVSALWDLSGLPELVTTVSALPLPADPVRLEVDGDLAYVMCEDRKLRVVDIADAEAPVLLATSSWIAGNVRQIAKVGDVLYVPDEKRGLILIDVSTPASPVEISVLSTGSQIGDVLVDGDLLWFANDTLELYDISIPDAPVLLAGHAISAATLERRVDHLFVAGASGSLRVYDVSAPLTPTFLGSSGASSSASNIQLVGDFAYVGRAASGIQVFDISDPTDVTYVETISTLGISAEFDLHEHRLYLADGRGGVQVNFIRSDGTIERIGHVYSDDARDVRVQSSFVYVAAGEGLLILPVDCGAVASTPVSDGNSLPYGRTQLHVTHVGSSPSVGSVQLRTGSDRALGVIEFEVVDVKGRTIKRHRDETTKKEILWTWSGATDSAVPAAAGVYWVLARTENGVARHRITLLR